MSAVPAGAGDHGPATQTLVRAMRLTRGATARMALGAALAGVLLLGLLTRDVIVHPPTYDELLHVLSARSLVATGEPTIADGRYDRALPYTQATAVAIRWATDDLVGARLVAWLGAALLVALAGAWTSRRAGTLAGLVAGLSLAAHPWTTDLAVFARFYTWHALSVFVAFVAVYEGVTARSWTWRTLAAATAMAATALALVLQITTVIAVGTIGLGVLLGVAVEHRERLGPVLRRHGTWLALAAVAALVAGFALLNALDLLAYFRETPLWSAGNANRLTAYTTALMHASPFLWPLMPIATVAACAANPRLGTTVAVAACVVLVAHSLAGAKASRYVYYALPWLCILLGAGAAAVASTLQTRRVRVLAGLLVASALLLTQESWRTLRLAAGADGYARVLGYGDETDWSPALPALRASLAAGDAVVTSNSMKALWYFGRYDYELNASVVLETESGREFGRDPRTGRRVVSAPGSVETILRARDRVLVVAETEKVGRASGVPADTVALLAGACAPLVLPDAAGLTAWSCPATAAAPPAPRASGG